MKEKVLDILKDGINDIEQVKRQYPKMHTQDVIDALRRLQDRINELTIPVVVSTFFCEDEDLGHQTEKCNKQCDACSWIEKRVAK